MEICSNMDFKGSPKLFMNDLFYSIFFQLYGGKIDKYKVYTVKSVQHDNLVYSVNDYYDYHNQVNNTTITSHSYIHFFFPFSSFFFLCSEST